MANIFLEKTLEQIIYENRKVISEKGLPVFYENAKRQFCLPSGKIVDIFTWELDNGCLKFRIIELKREDIDDAAYWQILKYVNEFVNHIFGMFKKIEYSCVLIGSGLSTTIASASIFPSELKLYQYRYGFPY